VAKGGIWHDTPLNQELFPMDSSSTLVQKEDGTEAIITDLKVEKCTRLCFDPSTDLEKYEVNFASIFIVEINSSILHSQDIYKVKRIGSDRIEYLKNIGIQPFYLKRVIVYAKAVEKQLRELLSQNQIRLPVIRDPQLFGNCLNPYLIDPGIIIKSDFEPVPREPLSQSSCITIHKGDLLKSKAQTIVNSVNCVGIMGKGVALAFKRQYPQMFEDYKKRCFRQEVSLGHPYPYEISRDRIIINFPTKGHWRENSKIENIEKGLIYLVNHIEEWRIRSIAFPPLGCTNGGLDWDVVFSLMRKHLSPLSIPVEIYAPTQANAFSLGSKRSLEDTESRKKIKE
jgi:O-acetyl-ADP-ribose deacetylase (regulator of RNase III)